MPTAVVPAGLEGPAVDLAGLPVQDPAVGLESPGVDLESLSVDIAGPSVDFGSTAVDLEVGVGEQLGRDHHVQGSFCVSQCTQVGCPYHPARGPSHSCQSVPAQCSRCTSLGTLTTSLG